MALIDEANEELIKILNLVSTDNLNAHRDKIKERLLSLIRKIKLIT